MIKNALKKDIWILLLDIVAVNLAYYLALAFRVAVNNMGGIFGSPSDVPVYFSAFYRIAPIYTVLCIIVFFLFKLYGGVWRFAGINDMYRILGAWLVTTLLQLVVSFLTMRAMNFNFARMPATYYMLGCVLQLLFVTAIRFGPKTVADEKRRRAKKAEKALVIGAGELGQQTVKMLQSGVNYDVSFIVDTEDEHVGLLLDGIPVYGLQTLKMLLEKNDIKCIFLAEPHLSDTDRKTISAVCSELKIEMRESRENKVDPEKRSAAQLQFVPISYSEDYSLSQEEAWLQSVLSGKDGGKG
jgi:FlaA1/EpsC-like NDP-sugar epimerase